MKTYGLIVKFGERHEGSDRYPTLILTLEDDIRRLLIEADTIALELLLNDALVDKWFGRVYEDDDQRAGSRHANDLPALSFAILGAFDDPRQIKQLDLGTFVLDYPRDASQRGELVLSDLREHSGELIIQ